MIYTNMTSAAETFQTIQKALGPYVRPREEAEHIRRVLALNLQSCHENGPQNGPLALAEPECVLKTTDARGLQRDYLKALHANIKAQREYETVSQIQTERETGLGSPSLSDPARLEEHLTTIKLRRKQERLRTVERYLDVLGQKPEASLEFLQPEELFKGTRRLPDVPKAVVSGFTVDKDSAKTDLKALVDRLEKAVLRSKLLLKQEEQLLEEVRSRSTISPGEISDGAKLTALNTTRNELITWMETELGKASAMEEPSAEETGRDGHGGFKVDKGQMDEQLALIREKYASYVAARKTLIQLVAQSPRPSIKPPEKARDGTSQLEPLPPTPFTHLVTPYVQKLLSVAHEQKASIIQKSHLNEVLAKQTEDTGRALDRLAEESQLLPDHPSRRRQGRPGGDLPGKGGHEISNRALPWVSAADSAKLATLEAVAETIEEGQVALEGSTKHLAEIDQLLGRNAVAVDGDATEDDIWLAETQTPRKGSKAPARSDAAKEPRDVWSLLDGNLGLINAEDSPRR